MPNGDGPHEEVWEKVKHLQEHLHDARDRNRQLVKELEEAQARVKSLEKALADKVVGST